MLYHFTSELDYSKRLHTHTYIIWRNDVSINCVNYKRYHICLVDINEYRYALVIGNRDKLKHRKHTQDLINGLGSCEITNKCYMEY